MQLKSLEVQGFKTFPDRTALQFDNGITSVVGPNGSGKSNISDSMRWVMGEQSVRVLRCSKMEDVIFSGTPRRKAQGYAEVTLNIDNTDRRLDFDNDNVAVTRRYYRSGESEYLINKTIVRLKDVNELFMDTGLGRDGYSIIGQGKIDSIVAARSEDRREIFEEAAGISRFRYRKEESERRLNKAEENLIRLRDILSELEDRVEPLRRQAQQAEKFIAYDSEKKNLEISLWVDTLSKSGEILRVHSEKSSIAKNQLQQANDSIEELSAETEKTYFETGELAVKIDSCREEAAAFEEQAVRTDSEISVIKNDIFHNNQQIQRLEKQILAADASEQETLCELEKKNAEIQDKTKDIEESRKKLDSFNQRLEDLRKGTDKATADIEEIAMKIAQHSSSVSETKIYLSSIQSSESEVQLRTKAVEQSIAAAQDRILELKKESEELENMLTDTRNALNTGKNSVQGYEMRLQNRKSKADSSKKEMDRISLDAAEQERRAKLLSDLERNLEGFAQSVKAVMRESQRGILKGVYGPITKIIKTPKEYAVALETALGAAMQNIVVETEADAKSAIQFLKKNNAGRATFLPRVTIKGRSLDTRDVENMPGFVGIASQLCGCEDKFSGIKESLLGRVAVAEDLDSAVSIAKKSGYRFRIVSLDGQVVNAGGSLTGGAKAKNSGLLSRRAEIERIAKQAAKLRETEKEAMLQYQMRQQEMVQCEAELQAAKSEYSVLQQDYIKFEAEYNRAEKDAQMTNAQLLELSKEQDCADIRLDELQTARNKSEEKLEELEKEIEILTEKNKKLLENRQDQLERCEDINIMVQEIRQNEYAAQKDRDTLQQSIEELKRRSLIGSEEITALKNEVSALENSNQELDFSIEETKRKAQDFKSKAEEKRNLANETANRRLALEQRSGELRKKERELTANREQIGQELARLQERSENLQKEYDDIISKLWEEYELTRKEAEECSTVIEDSQGARRRLADLKNKIKALGVVNVAAVVEYKEVSQRYEFLKTQIGDIEKSKSELISLIGDLTKQMREQFVERFSLINENFTKIFRELFGGGNAELLFSDESDVLNSGIEIKVHPPGKIVTHIESLSGGEKALVAISIYFAIMRVSPPPFCVLDEIEAALDDVNVTRFAQYLRRMSGETQFIVITHRRGTMEGSDMLYGVTMQDQGVSKLLKLKTHQEAHELQAIS